MKKVFATITIGCLIAAVASLAQLPKPNGGSVSGGAGHATTYGAYASLPGTCSTGDRYFTSDSIYEFLCTATNTWTPFYEGREVTVPTLTGFGWENQGTATVSGALGYLYLAIPAGQAAVNFRMHVRAVPAAPYTFTTLVRENLHTTPFAYAGLCLRQDAADDNIFFGFNTRGATEHLLRVVSFTDNAATGESVKASRTIANTELWLRITDNETNHLFQWSIDGVTFYTLYSAGRTAIITADQIGYSISDENDLPASAMIISASFE